MNIHRMVNILLTAIVLVLLVSSQTAIARPAKGEMVAMPLVAGSTTSVGPTTAAINAIASQVIPQGVPAVYGSELGVNYSQAVAAMPILESYDRGDKKITFTGEKLERYVRIASLTACEYCCGARTLVFKDGSAACGCAHSAAMRGVIAYLIEKHGGEMSDDEILVEANRWKATYFPRQTVEKALAAAGQASGGSGLSGVPSQVGGC